MTRKIMLVLLPAALMALGCDSGGKSGGGDAPKASAAAAGDSKLDETEIPVPEDFEQEAQSKVTPETYDDQLAAMEKEIEADKE